MNFKKLTSFLLLSITFCAYSQFKVRDDGFVQVGYDDYSVLTIGDESANPQGNNGKWALEHFNGGLNFWIPWPTLNSGNYKLFLKDDGNVAIGGTGVTGYKLSVYGSAIATQWFTASDERLKKNIKPITGGLDKIKQLRPVSYNYDYDPISDTLNASNLSSIKQKTLESDSKNHFESKKTNGFLAQEFRTVLPESVKEDKNGILSINYNDVIPLLVESIKEQQQIIENLENKIESLEINTDNKRTGSASNASVSQLFNNFPNPFNNTTEIGFYLSQTDIRAASTASVDVYNMSGFLIKSIPLNISKGENRVTFSKDNLEAGLYAYSLVIDGNSIDTETMIITK